MRRRERVAGIFAWMLLAGCGGGGGSADTSEKVVGDMIAEMKSTAAIIGKVSDEASARAAVAELEGVAKRMDAIVARQKKLPPASDAVHAKYDPEIMAVQADIDGKIDALEAKDKKAADIVKEEMTKNADSQPGG